MKSCALLRTNVGLTTNLKFMVSSNYGLYLDSIESTPELSNTRYKKFQFSKDDYWDDLVSLFFQKTPVDVAYKIKYDDDVSDMSSDFANQYDDLYQYGARNIIDNKYYKEEYEYFAPLFLSKNLIPKNFIIFRIDGPGLMRLDKNNFREEFLLKLKFVKNFDLSLKTNLGQFINKNFSDNRYYPNNSLYIDFRRLEFSSWKGIDYDKGGYIEKNFLLDSTLEYEQPFYEMEKFILEGYKNNKVVFPNIINFSFLFDDTPATPVSLRKWSLNRYLGFYFDELTLVRKLSPNKLPSLKSDVVVSSRNILFSPSSESPFLEDWKDNLFPYVEIGGAYYKIEEFEEITSKSLQKVRVGQNSYEEKQSRKTVKKYKIISDISLEGKSYSEMNQNLVFVDSDKRLISQTGDIITIDEFDSADIWLIQIGDHFHNIVREDNYLKLFTDYGFNQSVEKFEYYINSPDPNYIKTLDLITKKDTPPIEFNIYKCKFTDVKDFDTDVVETEFAKFEYIKSDSLTNTDEPKMYVTDLDSKSNPKDYIEFKLQNNVVYIPTSSEYTANSESFRIISDTLNGLWRKNSERVKWGLQGSISSNDYPYLLNNTLISEDFNKTSNTKDLLPQRDKRNLDYFYTINSDSSNYEFQSLHVENHINGILETNFKFELDKYLGVNYDSDYFSYFFGKKTFFQNGEICKRTNKYSYFQNGDGSIPNTTLFRGIKFNISEIENINIVDDRIEKINLKNTNKFDSWKFSILVSSNDYIITSNNANVNSANILRSENVLRWSIIDEWKHEKDYATNSLVIYDQVIYKSLTHSRIIDPTVDPVKSNDWQAFNEPTIFYSPSFSGYTYSNNMSTSYLKFPPLVYNYGEYYYSSGNNLYNFWDSSLTYSTDDIVTYRNKNWVSLRDKNRSIPSDISGFFTQSIFYNYWEETNLPTRWKNVELWRSDYDYSVDVNSSWNANLFTKGHYVVYNDVVYGTTASPVIGVSPNLDSNWIRIYSMVPDTDYFYSKGILNNEIVEMNNKFYKCLSNSYPTNIDPQIFYNFSLDNGIYVFINEKYKNILVNIYINDNTYTDSEEINGYWQIVKDYLKNTNRDDIYKTIYTKLTAYNLMNCLNDLSNKFGFSDLVKYVIIGEDSSVKIYDFNNLKSLNGLPYLLTCQSPDEFFVRNKSNIIESLSLKPSEFKSDRLLNDSNIESLRQLNYYNEMSLASKITKNVQTTVLIPNYSGLKNDIFSILYRHSGYYSPILKNVELFDSPSMTQSITNYKFDTELTDFGLVKQRMVSKVNKRGSLLKLRNNGDLKSIYPMIEEYGYHIIDFFIFKSTWDFDYHYETQYYELETETKIFQTSKIDPTKLSFKNNNTNLL